jgi:ribosomal protein S18 acetylase RimI-like enzyme
MKDIHVRPYQPSDQQVVFKIAAETAFFGEPVESFMDDRRLFCDLVVRYYTTYEADHCWVAEGEQGVIGYLLGCIDTSTQIRMWIRKILPFLVRNLLRGNYRIGKRTLGYMYGMVIGYLNREEPELRLADYPAHLHINVQKDHRGSGSGRLLMNTYLGQLRNQEVRGVSLGTTNLNLAAIHLYEKFGFKLLGKRNSRYWTRIAGQRVENLRYGIKFR